MAYEYSQIIELFEMLTLSEKEILLKKLQKIIVQERNAPEKSPLEEAWTDIQRNIKKLSRYSYVDDQLEIDMIWETCENLIKSGALKNESWRSRERVLKEIIENEFFDYYGVSDPMNDLMKALCVTKEENLLCAALIDRIGSDYMRKYGAEIYKTYGKAEKYYDYLEQHLSDDTAPYLELIEHYKASNADRAVEIAEYGLKKCRKDQTDLFIYLLQHARETGDEVKIAKLLRSAKLRRAVNYDKVLEQLNQEIPSHYMTDTLAYYDKNAETFRGNTQNVVFTEIQDKFLNYLNPGAKILDFGCGSGRDTKYFLDRGFQVDATDGSTELAKIASQFTQMKVKQMLFQELDAIGIYDGIWACSSILHLTREGLADVFIRIARALVPKGIVYTSFKYGTEEAERDGRYFTDMTEEKIKKLLEKENLFLIEDVWVTTGVCPEREDEKWLNLILRKKS